MTVVKLEEQRQQIKKLLIESTEQELRMSKWVTRNGDPVIVVHRDIERDIVCVYHCYTGINERHHLDGRLYNHNAHNLDLMRPANADDHFSRVP